MRDRFFVGFVWCGLGQGKFVALTQQGTRNFALVQPMDR